MDKDFDDIVNLSVYSVEDSCLWLLSKLDATKHADKPYARPYCNYVMTWHNAIPLTAIIMAQSPYPNAIYPEIAAAMSYDKEKCRKLMNVESPPTVRILANDLNIHTGMSAQDVDTVVMSGWSLVSSGILLINSAVFHPYGSTEAYDECMNQVNVLNRMLVETEKFGKRTVDIIAYGAGQAMASELTKGFKSDIIKLTKFSSVHPASLSYRMSDFTSPNCHLDAPSTSRTVAKHFSNHVAYAHTMAKKSETEIKAQRQLDTIRSLGEQLVPLRQVSEELFPAMRNLIKYLEEDDVENFKMALQQIVHTSDTFIFRLGTTSAALSQAQASAGSVGSTVSKPGPSLTTTSPSMASLSQHVGSEFKSVTPMAPKPFKLGARSRRASTDTGVSDVVNISSPPSVISESSNVGSINTVQPAPVKSRTIKFRKSSAPTTGTQVMSPQRVITPIPEDTTTSTTEKKDKDEDKETTSSMGARLRKSMTTQGSSQSGNSGKAKERQELNPDWVLDVDMMNQLSCIEVIIQSHAPERLTDDDVSDMLEGIQSDIQSKTAYNMCTQRLVAAIKDDLLVNPKFNLANWAVDTSKKSTAFDQCKEEFEF